MVESLHNPCSSHRRTQGCECRLLQKFASFHKCPGLKSCHLLLVLRIASAYNLDAVQMTADIRQFFGHELYVRTTDVFLDTLDVFRVSPIIFCFDNPFSISTSLSSKAMDASP